MMRNLVVCCDGTWNTPDESKAGVPTPSNVAKLSHALVQDEAQLVYYHSGVGTGEGWWDHIVGGGAGAGLDQNTMGAYLWLARSYQPDDRIYVFGFSRGAYTARCAAGLVARYGLLDLTAVDSSTAWDRVEELFASYRKREDFPNPKSFEFFNQKTGPSQRGSTPIFFIGVWDTVGAMGIPDDFAVLGLLDSPEKYQFYDATWSQTVAHGRHALALDEKRASFAPTLWTDVGGADVKQLWFPGVHSDIGGGYPETGLSDCTLKWMLDEAALTSAKGWGLRYHPGIETQVKPDPLGVLHDSCTGIFDFLKSRPRSIPPLDPDSPNLNDLHETTKVRLETPPLSQGEYRRTVRLAEGDSRTVDVFARQRWNETTLYLEAGVVYRFDAAGEWLDRNDSFGPEGGEPGFRLSDVARWASDRLGSLEPYYGKLTGAEHVDFWYTKRVQDAPWFALVGFVANNVEVDDPKPGDLPTGQTFVIRNSCVFTPTLGGYLYCFANDTWQTYRNNRGSVKLTVSRL